MLRLLRPSWIAAILTVCACACSPAQQASGGSDTCAAPEYRRFDFRIGTFDVTTARGERAGTSTVESLLQGCLLVEHWAGAQGGDGRAHYFYDRATQRWQLVFVNDDAQTLRLAANAGGSDLVFTGRADFYAYRGLHRMVFTALDDGGVRQFWEWSADAGASWAVVIDARYARQR